MIRDFLYALKSKETAHISSSVFQLRIPQKFAISFDCSQVQGFQLWKLVQVFAKTKLSRVFAYEQNQ